MSTTQPELKRDLRKKLLTETIIKQNRFKKEWLHDKSGHWWVKSLGGKALKVRVEYDQDINQLDLIITLPSDIDHSESGIYIQTLPGTITNLKRILINGTLIAAAK